MSVLIARLATLALAMSSANAVIQGQPAERPYAESYAAISFGPLRTCGAVAIDARHVITGAHCLTIGGVDFADIANSLGLLRVAKGNVGPASADQEVSVADIAVHPGYTMDIDTGKILDDIAILTLDANEPLDAPYAEIAETVPERGVAVGLGMNDLFDFGQPDELYQVELDVFGVEGGSIAAGKHVSSPIPSICWGDSGGGFYEPVGAGENRAVARVFGLVSWEPEPSRCTDRTTDEQFFTNLAYYREWVNEQVNQRETEM
jgi:secreted trypsin-like serine protease